MFKVYILKSIPKNKFYIGHTHDIDERLKKHNKGLVKSTKYGVPWNLLYTENYATKQEAYKREMEIKKYKGGIQFKILINNFDI